MQGLKKFDGLVHRSWPLRMFPWHDWEFDIRTGKSVVDPERIKISAYPTEISAVEGAGHSPPTGFNSDGMPFELETYPVSIDERYVVLEI
jgi:3-phenylpropionate/trans-cinnamate dioxygenase ferredoxin subunit